ncbi:MAG: L-threonylcarbamoyladenylate synthase [Pseudomonadota bacterium]
MTQRLDAKKIDQAAAILRAGGLVAFATETVYGLGADATDGEAVARIYEAKGRPSFNPLIVHVAGLAAAKEIAVFNDVADQLAAAFWPGPLTLILPLKPTSGLSSLVTAGLPNVAIRIPALQAARRLITATDRPIAAPSANPSGRVSATTADHVFAGLEGRIDAVIDFGPCEVGLESTILSVAGDITLAREGGLPLEAIEHCLGRPVSHATTPDKQISPGQMLSHYAPKSPIRLNATRANPHESFLGFGPTTDATLNLSPAGDLREAAANLFAHLHTLDALGKPIAVAPIPSIGLGAAINDRLTRAAA